jgi:PKD domain
VTTPVSVSDAALHATGISASSRNPFSGVVATFSDDDPNGTVSDYTASIAWGDGSTSSGTVGIHTGFNVSGTHRYKKPGTYKVTVTIKDAGGSTATANSTITITAAAPVHHGSARLTGIPASCTLSAFRVQVKGKLISSAAFSLGGRHLKSRTVHRGKQYAATLSLSPGTHRLTVKVKFRKSSHTAPRTFHRTVSGCKAPPPKFTG